MTDWLTFLPELAVLLTSLIFFTLTFVPCAKVQPKLFPMALLCAVLVMAASVAGLGANGFLFGDCYQLDLLSQIFKLAIALAFFFVICFSDKVVAINQCVRPEYYFFLSSATLGLMMLTSAVELLTLYVSLELASYSLYILVPLRKQGLLSAEGGIKYLLFGAAASGLMLYGMSLLFGFTQQTYFSQMASNISFLTANSSLPAVMILGFFLMLAAFFFKLSAFPFHFWAPDAYESGATQVTAFIATASKATAIAVFLRLFQFFGPTLSHLTPIFVWIAFISMTLGNLVALIQSDMKRMLAYSSIAQAGYMLVALLAQTPEGYAAVLFYAIIYIVMNAAAFLVTDQVARSANHDNPQIETFSGLAERSPLLALTLLLSLLSLAGIPPLVGFAGKWVIFTAAMEKGYLWLVLAGVINSVISLYYYLMVVKQAYWGKPPTAFPILVPAHTRILCYGFIIAIIALGIFPTFLVVQAQNAIAENSSSAQIGQKTFLLSPPLSSSRMVFSPKRNLWQPLLIATTPQEKIRAGEWVEKTLAYWPTINHKIQALLEIFEEGDSSYKKIALQKLINLDPREALKPTFRALKDYDPVLKMAGIEALISHFEENTTVLDELQSLRNSSQKHISHAALQALLYFNIPLSDQDSQTIRQLFVNDLSDENPYVRRKAIEGLARLTISEEVKDSLLRIAHHDPVREVRDTAILVLWDLGASGQEIYPGEEMKWEQELNGARKKIKETLSAYMKLNEQIHQVMEALKNGNVSYRQAALQVLYDFFYERAIFFQQAQEEGLDLSETAKIRDQILETVLKTIWQDPNPFVRKEAIRTLEQIAHERELRIPEELIERVAGTLKIQKRNPLRKIRQVALEAMLYWGINLSPEEKREVRTILVRKLEKGEKFLRVRALDGLLRLPQTGNSLETILSAAEDENNTEYLRDKTLRVLGKRGELMARLAGEEVLVRMKTLLIRRLSREAYKDKKDVPYGQLAAIIALIRLNSDIPEIFPLTDQEIYSILEAAKEIPAVVADEFVRQFIERHSGGKDLLYQL